jgi:succinate dehydrogenase/fumarate reductase flavoprotein subunit
MVYPPHMQASLDKVVASRARRLKERFPSLTADEKQALLRTFHPDYVAAGFRELRLGPNKGGKTLRELAEALEGRSRVDPRQFDLGRVDAETDVLVIGGGGAGASAALLANDNGARVILATKLRFGDANTMMAQGGIQAADKANDSPAIHYLDVLGGGSFTNVPELVHALVMDGPLVIKWLESLGCMFDKDADGTMKTIHGGGTSRKRMHFSRDYSGAEIMRTLRDEVRSRDVTVLEFSPAIELVMDGDNRVAGAILLNMETGETSLVRAKAVVIATGGGGRLHYQGFPTTNHYGATADGLVLAYRVGAKLLFIDTMQYHPTGAAYPQQILGQLVTEKVRGLGAQVANGDGEQFVYPLETRDAESAAIIRECAQRKRGVATGAGLEGIWLDSPMIDVINGAGAIARELPAMVRQYQRFGIDMTKDPILVYPTLHYQNGGVSMKPDGATDVPGLYVAGEVSGGVHGRNRLMGNSLLDITVFGRRSGRAAAAFAATVNPAPLTLAHVERWEEMRLAAGEGDGILSPLLLPDYTRHPERPILSMVGGTGAGT